MRAQHEIERQTELAFEAGRQAAAEEAEHAAAVYAQNDEEYTPEYTHDGGYNYVPNFAY